MDEIAKFNDKIPDDNHDSIGDRSIPNNIMLNLENSEDYMSGQRSSKMTKTPDNQLNPSYVRVKTYRNSRITTKQHCVADRSSCPSYSKLR